MDLYTIPMTDSSGTDGFILYRPLLGMAFVGNQAMVDLTRAMLNDDPYDQGSDEVVAFLQTSGFLVPALAPTVTDHPFHPAIAVLLLTNQCQLRCTYCYASAGELPRQDLTPELGRVIIDTVCENAQAQKRPHFEVSFHGGGEPTLAWETLQACTEYARSKPFPAKITLTSNGMWSQQHCAWLLDHLDGISLSMDGGPQTQDTQRPTASGGGSFTHVRRVITEMDRHKFPYGIRMTATAPWENLPEDVRFLCEETNCPSMQVEPAFNTKRGGHGWALADEALAFGEAFLEAYEIATQAGRRLYYSGARLGLVTNTFCSAPYQALIVNASGKLVTCYEIASEAHALEQISVIGQVAAGEVQVDQAARAHLHGLMAERRQACQDCYCYWSCAGDCYTRAFLPGTEGHLALGARCELNRFLMKKLLLRGVATGGGLWVRPKSQGNTYKLTQNSEAITI